MVYAQNIDAQIALSLFGYSTIQGGAFLKGRNADKKNIQGVQSHSVEMITNLPDKFVEILDKSSEITRFFG